MLSFIFSIILALCVMGVGYQVTRLFGYGKFNLFERLIFGFCLGFGIFQSGIFFIGVAGYLVPLVLITWGIVFCLFSVFRIKQVYKDISTLISSSYEAVATKNLVTKFLFLSGIAAWFITLLQALTPVWDYDGLMYHLTAAKLFLKQGQLYLLPDLWQANGANMNDMVFIFGLAFKDENLGKLFQFIHASLLIMSIYSFGSRFLDQRSKNYASLVFMATPVLVVWASWAYTDFGLALLVFLCLYTFLLWNETHERPWLVLCSICSGLALSNKYLAIANTLVLGVMIFICSLKESWRKGLLNTLFYGAITLLIASPWYLKNWILAGNPVFPFIFGGPGWDALRLHLLNTFLSSFGTGKQVLDYLLSPLNLFIQNKQYAGFLPHYDFPNPLFLLAPLYFLVRRSKTMDLVAIWIFFYYLFWLFTSQQNRFLLPIYPALSLLAGVFLSSIACINKKWHQMTIKILFGVMVFATLYYAGMYYRLVNPVPVILGNETKDAFLYRMVYDYPASTFIRDNLDATDRVMLLWNGQGYYCGEQCVPDSEQSRWTYLVLANQFNSLKIYKHLLSQEISHLMLSQGDVDFLLMHDPFGEHRRSYNFLLNEFLPVYGEKIYQDKWIELYQLK